jgi:regulatory protein
VESVEAAGQLDERAALESFLAARRARYGRERLRRELEHRGFPAEMMARALGSLSDVAEREKLERLVRQREAELAGLEPDRRRRRIFDFLRRRGFSAEEILGVLS